MKTDLTDYEYRVKTRDSQWQDHYRWESLKECNFSEGIDYQFRKVPFEPDYYRVCRGALGVRYAPTWCETPPWYGIMGYLAYQEREDWERVAITRKEDS